MGEIGFKYLELELETGIMIGKLWRFCHSMSWQRRLLAHAVRAMACFGGATRASSLRMPTTRRRARQDSDHRLRGLGIGNHGTGSDSKCEWGRQDIQAVAVPADCGGVGR